ncbi:MAG TPA: acetyl-CoA C-acetyltransferase [Methanomassiliicoccales archaeon]|nr:acetyl-CoA C-acetyltransferase [Methanomassiliicoccales archaeon]HQM66721.1 acetyl-CoA C-acetyltransferase [Methanomassiliicoccales archaeon]
MEDVVIIGAARTAIGKFNGSLRDVPAPVLGSVAIRAAVERSGLMPSDIEECLMGNVLSASLGQNPARQAAIGAGLPVEIGSTTINKVCGSGMKAVMLAANAIKAGEYQVIVAGGMENMNAAPYLLPQARFGYRLGDGKAIDHMVRDGLWDAFTDVHMGMTAETVAERFHVTREQADLLAYESHVKAHRAQSEGRFDREIAPVMVKGKKGETVFDKDEGIRPDTTPEVLAKLSPAFKKDGIVTAGNASQLSDGAAALVVCSRRYAEAKGIGPMAEIVGYATGGTRPEWIMEAPIPTTRRLLDRLGMDIGDIDLFEHNEAFATASVAVRSELGVPEDRFNVNGGAVALGHPIGCSGARVLTSLVYALKDRGKRTGLATLCLGGGNAVSMVVRA